MIRIFGHRRFISTEMARPVSKYKIKLRGKEKQELRQAKKQGRKNARLVIRVLIILLADAGKTMIIKERISAVDVIYQDVAQKNQIEIFLKNINMFLKDDGYALLALKARSIDVTKQPKQIFREAREKLEKTMSVIDCRELEPFQKDHCTFVCRKLKNFRSS